LEQFGIDPELDDPPTVVDVETVQEDLEEQQSGRESFSDASAETVEESLDDESLSLDPIPNADEIQSVDLDDVELIDHTAAAADAEEIDADAEPLDVGDLLGEDEPSSRPDVRMLRGESSFIPDEDSLQLRPDPLTGELTFQVPTDDGPTPSPSSDADTLISDLSPPADEVEDVEDAVGDDSEESTTDDAPRRNS
jgi:hypothetical protein